VSSGLEDQWILDHTSGAAPIAIRVLVDCAAELNPFIRSQIQLADEVGAALMATDLWDQMPMQGRDVDISTLNETPAALDALFPSALQAYGFTAASSPWRSKLGGVEGRKINRLCERGVDARLFKIRPGAEIPHHDHIGQELTLVLQGGFSDENGTYHRGDVCVGETGEPHTPIGLPGEACVCYAVSLGGYRFKNPLMSIAARILT